MLTRPVSGLWGGRRAGSFAGKGVSAEHPVGILTRPVSGLWGGQRAGSFDGRGDTEHPVGKITRVVSGLYGGRRNGSFAGRIAEAPPAEEPIAPIEEPIEALVVGGIVKYTQHVPDHRRAFMEYQHRRRMQRIEDEEILAIIIAIAERTIH